MRRLLKLGVNPNTSNLDLKGISFYRRGTSYKVNKDVERIPAIAYAIRLGHGAIVKLLLENGAAFNKAPKKNRNSRWHLDTSNALGFYLHPVDSRKLFARDSKGDFILTNEERKKLRQKLWKEWLDGLAVLIKKGINVNTRIRDRGTALKIVKGWAKHYKKQGEDVYDFAKIIKLLKAAGAK